MRDIADYSDIPLTNTHVHYYTIRVPRTLKWCVSCLRLVTFLSETTQRSIQSESFQQLGFINNHLFSFALFFKNFLSLYFFSCVKEYFKLLSSGMEVETQSTKGRIGTTLPDLGHSLQLVHWYPSHPMRHVSWVVLYSWRQAMPC